MPASRKQRATILAPRSWPSSPTLATSTRIGLCAITPLSPRPPPSYLGSAAAARPPPASARPGSQRGETARKCLSYKNLIFRPLGLLEGPRAGRRWTRLAVWIRVAGHFSSEGFPLQNIRTVERTL